MANATKRGNVGTTGFQDYITKLGAVSTAQTFYPNCLIGRTSAGYGDKLDDTAVKQFEGVLASHSIEVLTGGANGDTLLDIEKPRFVTVAFAAIAETDIGRIVYASDDQTGSLTPGSYGNVIGRLVYRFSDTSGLVECIYQGGQDRGDALQVISASGAVPIKQSTVLITDAAAAALTIADPTSGVHDGVEMTFISTTAQAHTLSNSAGSGFNAGGAASDVGTFAAAIGNGLTIVAYQGKWYVKRNTGVTLA